MSPLPYEPNPPKPDAPPLRTDLDSLLSAPVVVEGDRLLAEKPLHTRTDFQSLGGSALKYVAPRPRRTLTDWLLEVLTPLLILAMVYSAIFFLLDVRYIYTEVFDSNLRVVAFFFVMGVVALNRLIARDGSEESILYFLFLAAAIGMYTLASASMFDVNAMVKTPITSNAWIAVAVNMTIVALTWWVVNRLTHECCVDENPHAGEVGILTGTLRQWRASMQPQSAEQRAVAATPPPRVHKGWRDYFRREPEPMFQPNILEPFDPTEGYKPKAKPAAAVVAPAKLGTRHPGMAVLYFSVPVLLIFAFGLRVVQNGGPHFVFSGMVYMGIYTTAALLLLNLSSLASLREFFRMRGVRIPGGIGAFWVGLGLVLVMLVLSTAAYLPKPPLPEMLYVAERETDPWARYSAVRRSANLELVRPATLSPETIQRGMETTRWAGRISLGALALFLGYGALRALGAWAAHLARQRNTLPLWLRRFFDQIDRFIERLLRVPQLPSFRPRLRVQREIATSRQYDNSMGDPKLANQFTTAQHVQYAYQALCALAYDLGAPREVGQTPYEFIANFPTRLRFLEEDARELTELYVRASYSPIEMDDTVRDRLRRFWLNYNRARKTFVR